MQKEKDCWAEQLQNTTLYLQEVQQTKVKRQFIDLVDFFGNTIRVNTTLRYEIETRTVKKCGNNSRTLQLWFSFGVNFS